MNSQSEINRIVSRVIREDKEYIKNNNDLTKVDDKVIQILGMIIEECIDDSLKFAAHNSVSKNLDEIQKSDILYYIESNYKVPEHDIKNFT